MCEVVVFHGIAVICPRGMVSSAIPICRSNWSLTAQVFSSSYGGPGGDVGEDPGVAETCEPRVVRTNPGPGGMGIFS